MTTSVIFYFSKISKTDLILINHYGEIYTVVPSTDKRTAVPDILGLGYLSPADMNYIFVTYGKKF